MPKRSIAFLAPLLCVLAAVVLPVPAGSQPRRMVELQQGWSQADRELWWNSPQGSRIMPYDWFLRLEAAEGGGLFSATAHLAGYGYIPTAASALNPDALPIGLAREPGPAGGPAWLGMSCAACHVGTITWRGQTALVEGAGSMADIQRFDRELSAALAATSDDDARFARFADRLGTPAEGRAALRAALGEMARLRGDFTRMNTPPHEYGPGRVDALGVIMNALAATALNRPDNARAPDAPVRMPWVWNSPGYSRVQYNGSIANAGAGALLRNIGQTLGVYGTVDVSRLGGTGYPSSVSIADLEALEDLLRRLQPPAWPDFLPPIDQARAAQGQVLFAAQCAGCHQARGRDAQGLVPVALVPLDRVGTDPLAARNFMTRPAATGMLEGRPVGVFGGAVFGPRAGAATIVGHVSTAVAAQLPRERLMPMLGAYRQAVAAEPGRLDAYKAVPLAGIWAAAPYLHNGSVANLRELLTPPASRARRFTYAGREFDPAAVGYTADAPGDGHVLDTTLPGNSSAGHDYGTQLTEDERSNLIEFLKTL